PVYNYLTLVRTPRSPHGGGMCRSVRAVGASTLLVVLALCVDARSQDKKPEAAPTPAGQQDRIDIGPLLDSWYKVFQGAEAVGYVHEVLQRAPVGNPWRYQYDSDAESELQLPDPKDPKKIGAHTESLRI